MLYDIRLRNILVSPDTSHYLLSAMHVTRYMHVQYSINVDGLTYQPMIGTWRMAKDYNVEVKEAYRHLPETL